MWNFKLLFPAYNKIYLILLAVLVLLLCLIKEGNFLRTTWYKTFSVFYPKIFATICCVLVVESCLKITLRFQLVPEALLEFC